MKLSLEVPAVAKAVVLAREVVASALVEAPGLKDRTEDVRLLTSELVTNVVRHAGLARDETIGLGVNVSERRVRIEVADAGPGFRPPDISELPPDRTDGWGLVLVDGVADRWGVIMNEPNQVWFELSLLLKPASSER